MKLKIEGTSRERAMSNSCVDNRCSKSKVLDIILKQLQHIIYFFHINFLLIKLNHDYHICLMHGDRRLKAQLYL